ncbi:hypothetical protein [Phnomibacter sp. MR]|uniref:hypothetical protein n=1 Tax=Phnomibacter sp. MR TaxID=3042318 RepID=UPI003A80AA9C
MKKFPKVLVTLLVILIVAFAAYGIVKAGLGNYVQHASFITTGLIVIGFAALLYLSYKAVRRLWMMGMLAAVVVSGCNYAKSNQQVLVSTDCGMTWEAINAGDAVPKGTMNPCYMKVVIPNFPMQGESKFIGNLKDRVKVNVEIDYDYSITNGLSFIKEAKSLGKANADADADEALNSVAFESAENRVIDKRIREVAKSLFLNEDIVDMEQADLEEKLEIESNKLLEKYGVRLNFLTLTFIPDEQTRQAIDVATAMRIYESKGIKEVGEKVIAARAGAPKIVVENKTEPVQKTEQ